MDIEIKGSSALTVERGAVLERSFFKPWPQKPTGITKGRDKSVLEALASLEASAHMPEIVVYEHIDFGGAEWRTNLGWGYVGDFWNDKISSLIVVSGTWRFYEHAGLQGRYWDLTAGYYHWVEEAGVPNDLISSFQPIAL